MRYLRFRVELGTDGWYIRSPRASVEEQLITYPTRIAAVTAMRMRDEEQWARHLFEVDGS